MVEGDVICVTLIEPDLRQRIDVVLRRYGDTFLAENSDVDPCVESAAREYALQAYADLKQTRRSRT